MITCASYNSQTILTNPSPCPRFDPSLDRTPLPCLDLHSKPEVADGVLVDLTPDVQDREDEGGAQDLGEGRREPAALITDSPSPAPRTEVTKN